MFLCPKGVTVFLPHDEAVHSTCCVPQKDLVHASTNYNLQVPISFVEVVCCHEPRFTPVLIEITHAKKRFVPMV